MGRGRSPRAGNGLVVSNGLTLVTAAVCSRWAASTRARMAGDALVRGRSGRRAVGQGSGTWGWMCRGRAAVGRDAHGERLREEDAEGKRDVNPRPGPGAAAPALGGRWRGVSGLLRRRGGGRQKRTSPGLRRAGRRARNRGGGRSPGLAGLSPSSGRTPRCLRRPRRRSAMRLTPTQNPRVCLGSVFVSFSHRIFKSKWSPLPPRRPWLRSVN